MTSAESSPCYEPSGCMEDHFESAYVEKRCRAIPRLLELLGVRLPRRDERALRQSVALWHRLSLSARHGVICLPLFSDWWFRVWESYRATDLSRLVSLGREFGRFVAIPAIRESIWTDQVLTVPKPTTRELRFPGHACHVLLPESSPPTADHVIELRLCGDALQVDGALDVAINDLMNAGSDSVAMCPTLPGSVIQVDSGDPRVLAFLEQLNQTATDDNPNDLRPYHVDEHALAQLQSARAYLRAVWPPLADEFDRNVRLIVLFESAAKKSFSNTAWQGALFLQRNLDELAFLVERLVHEASHLRLNLILDHVPLLDHDFADEAWSPFRGRSRPLLGLYHGVFVFTRVWDALDRVHRSTGHDSFPVRIGPIREKVRVGLQTLSSDRVRLTPAGQQLLTQVAEKVARLESEPSTTKGGL